MGQIFKQVFSPPDWSLIEKGEFSMFPNNPLFVDKLLQSRQEDIERGIPDPHSFDIRQSAGLPVKLRVKSRIWVSVGMLLALAWLFHALV